LILNDLFKFRKVFPLADPPSNRAKMATIRVIFQSWVLPMSTSCVQPGGELYEFGPFLLDPQKEVLLRSGDPVALNRKAFQILMVLVRHGKEVVTKDELMKEVWPNTFVEEGNLSTNIFMLRKALGESPQDHQYILTVPGRGYRFAEDVSLVSKASVSVVAAKHSRIRVHIEETDYRILTALTLLALIVGYVTYHGVHHNSSLPAAAGAARTSVAVLPLHNLSGDAANDYFSGDVGGDQHEALTNSKSHRGSVFLDGHPQGGEEVARGHRSPASGSLPA
jgi:DNA-binding winged helix-turn-helix (wHTH) protein